MDTTTVKALRVIEALAVSEEPRGVAELSRQLGLTKSNTFRILSTLTEQGYARSHPETGRYWLTLKIWEQGAKVIERLPVRRVAQPYMKVLFSQLNEVILMSVLDWPAVLYIDKMDADYPMRASARVGWRSPAWRTASGKAMLAFHPDEVIDKLSEDGLISRGELADLRKELREVRKRGYAVSFSGTWPGMNSVAAPIWGGESIPAASLSVSGPAERFSKDRMNEISASVMNASTRISESLGVSLPIHGNFAVASS